jgi:hypothetical protein
MRLLIALLFLGCAKQPPAVTPSGTNPKTCHGERRALVIARQMPLSSARVGGLEGLFVLDTATTSSTIDSHGFSAPPPRLPGTEDQYEPFEFFGSWGRVRLNENHLHGLAGSQPVAGLIGTDFLSQHVYTFNYAEGVVHRADAREFCADDVMVSEGFKPLSTEGYYAADASRIMADVPNVPTIPIRIAGVAAIAQIDTAFTDSMIRHSVNINRALLDKLVAAGAKLTKGEGIPLSTCVPNVWETTYIYRGVARFEMMGMDGHAVRASDDATFLLKESPPAAHKCGGIGTWKTPAAQIGASFYVDAGRIVFDPFTSRVWMPPS